MIVCILDMIGFGHFQLGNLTQFWAKFLKNSWYRFSDKKYQNQSYLTQHTKGIPDVQNVNKTVKFSII